MPKSLLLVSVAISSSLLLAGSEHLQAQNSVKLFGSTFVRTSTDGTSGSQPNTFNSATVNLTCNTSNGPIRAVLSSTPDGTGNVLVDNFINVTLTTGSSTGTPANVCRGGNTEQGPSGTQNNCFNATYRNAAPSLTGTDLDTYTATGGVAPIDIGDLLANGTQQAKIDIVDTGTLLANASLYLVTSCTASGVTGPATITGNPISGTNPTPDQLSQDFDFNSNPGQNVGFTYDLTTSKGNGQVDITDGTIPNTSDMPLDPALWQPQYATGTSFATSSCMIHNGELLNGSPACKLYTLTCQVGSGATSKGALCPISQLRDEIFSDKFTGPIFTLPDITGPNGKTYHQGVGFLMAGEGWTGGPCSFDQASGLQTEDCPQNLLTNFSSVGTTPPAAPAALTVSRLAISALAISFEESDMDFDGTGTHPNSTFISVAQVPEDLTTVTVQGQHPGGWVNSRNINLSLSSEPPVIPDTVPNHQNFVPSPIKSLTYGVSTADSVPPTKFAVPGDVTLTNPVSCPVPTNLHSPAASTFVPGPQAISVPADGQYALHYFAQDCAGTQELKFTSDGNGGWATSFYTVPINVDTVAPVLVGGLTLSAQPKTINGTPNAFVLNQPITLSYRCTDDRSGIATCGTTTFGAPGTLNTGTLTATLDTSTVGNHMLTVPTIDFAGNPGTPAQLTYNVVRASSDMSILQLAPATVRTGSLLTYDMLALNFGPATAFGIKIKDTLPAGTTFVSAGFEDISCALFGGCNTPAASACSLAGNMVVCDAGQLAPLSLSSLNGIGVQVVVRVTAPANTVLSNTVSVESVNSDPNPGNNTSKASTLVRR
jgi:uncharacterized repeat protein (TIGR01451 family)